MGFFIAVTGVECQSVNEEEFGIHLFLFFLFPPKIILKNKKVNVEITTVHTEKL
jgi:hypothetical protein